MSGRWWVLDGWGTDVMPIGSGAFALGLIVYSYGRFYEPAHDASHHAEPVFQA